LWKHKHIFTWILLTSVGVVLCADLLQPPSEDWCTGLGYLPDNRPTSSVHAIKVVSEPLTGRHQVYGIFQVPISECPPGQPVILRVRGAGTYCENAGTEGVLKHLEGIKAPPGYYLTKHYIRTRTALWLSIQGFLDRLRQPQNWTLTYTE
jgi:hypothetical protein